MGKPYTQALSSRVSDLSPQRVPTERFQVPAQHHQIMVNVRAHIVVNAQSFGWVGTAGCTYKLILNVHQPENVLLQFSFLACSIHSTSNATEAPLRHQVSFARLALYPMSLQTVGLGVTQDRGQWTEEYARWRRRNSIAPEAKVLLWHCSALPCLHACLLLAAC